MRLLLALSLIGCLLDCKSTQVPKLPPLPPEDAQTAASAVNAFGFDLYKSVAANDGNFAISPLSLSLALTMTWAGARSETEKELRAALHQTLSPAEGLNRAARLSAQLASPDRKMKLQIANQLFGQRTYAFETDFVAQMRANFGAPLESLDFVGDPEGGRAQINSWVSAHTEQKIVNLLPANSISPSTRLALVNALYFHANWKTPFDAADTTPAQFSVNEQQSVRAPTMHLHKKFRAGSVDDIQLLELPYQDESMTMLLALPPLGKLAVLEASLSNSVLATWDKALTLQETGISLPKFELNAAAPLSLATALQNLGVKRAFDPSQADFSAIAKPSATQAGLFISNVFHKTFVKVDEKGTEAAAATAVIAVEASARLESFEFNANRPFVFLLRDTATGAIVFVGRLSDPTKN